MFSTGPTSILIQVHSFRAVPTRRFRPQPWEQPSLSNRLQRSAMRGGRYFSSLDMACPSLSRRVFSTGCPAKRQYMTEQYYTLADLKTDRGWTDTRVRKVLGEPDATRRNPHSKTGHQLSCFCGSVFWPPSSPSSGRHSRRRQSVAAPGHRRLSRRKRQGCSPM